MYPSINQKEAFPLFWQLNWCYKTWNRA